MARDQKILGDTTPERLEAFSDGVFSIAITLAALDIRLPEGVPPNGLGGALLGLLPELENYVISFGVVGIFWVSHHGMFNHIKRTDHALLWMNLVFLMFITFMPFFNILIRDYDSVQLATIIFAVSMAFTSLLASAMWWYASHKRRLIDHHISEAMIRRVRIRTLIPPAVFLLSILVSFINLDLAQWSWLLIALARPMVNRRIREHSGPGTDTQTPEQKGQ